MNNRAVNTTICLLISSIALLIPACSSSDTAAQTAEAEQDGNAERVTVAVARVIRENLSQHWSLAADLIPYQEVELHAKVAGYVKEMRVDVGDRVRAGDVIATLEVPEFTSDLRETSAETARSRSEVVRARAELQRAQSGLNAARLVYSRLASVSESRPELIARQEVDDARAKLRAAEAQVEAARAAVAVAENQVELNKAGHARAQTMAAYTVIQAPFSGVITKRYADEGSMIQAGTASHTQAMALVRLSQLDHLRLVLPVPESIVPRIRIGRAVRVQVPAVGGVFKGRIARYSARIALDTRTMEAEVDVPNPDEVLKPGMHAVADLMLEEKTAALAVPVQALSHEQGKTSVLVVNEANRLEPRDIGTGIETPDSVEILSGLKENELVVIGSRNHLQAGQLVTPKEIPLELARGEY